MGTSQLQITNTTSMLMSQFQEESLTSWELRTKTSPISQMLSREDQLLQLQICLSRQSTSQSHTIHASMTTSATPATTHMCTTAIHATMTTTVDTTDAKTSTLATTITTVDTTVAETSTPVTTITTVDTTVAETRRSADTRLSSRNTQRRRDPTRREATRRDPTDTDMPSTTSRSHDPLTPHCQFGYMCKISQLITKNL